MIFALYLFSNSNSFCVPLDDKPCESATSRRLGVRVGPCEHKVPAGMATVGDPHLGTVQDVVIALADSLGLDASDVGSSSWFRYTVSLQ